jgi:deoxyribodipyrimidine photolyase
VDWFFGGEQEEAAERLAFRWQPVWRSGHAALERFLARGLAGFSHDRARTDRESSTMLSPWVHMGSVSVRCAGGGSCLGGGMGAGVRGAGGGVG